VCQKVAPELRQTSLHKQAVELILHSDYVI
jgi:hypothetical protein